MAIGKIVKEHAVIDQHMRLPMLNSNPIRVFIYREAHEVANIKFKCSTLIYGNFKYYRRVHCYRRAHEVANMQIKMPYAYLWKFEQL